MSVKRYSTGALVVALVVAVLTALGVSPAAARGKHGPVAWGSSSCAYSGQTLTQMKVTPPRASMDKTLVKRGGTAQYVGVSVTLQGLSGATWKNVVRRPGRRGYAATVLVHPRRLRSVKHASLMTFSGSALPAAYSSFRVAVTLRWYAYDGRHVRGSVTRTFGPCARIRSYVTRMVAGSGDACALMSNASMRCWGYNGNGRLGNGTSTNQARPITPIGMSAGVQSIAAATWATCAVQGYASKCWGNNAHGEFGNGTTTSRTSPTPTTGLGTTYRVFGGAGSSNLCATTGSGVKCWGSDAYGQNGDGNTVNDTTPVAVTGLPSITSVATGTSFACAAGGTTAWCWGNNTSQQLGATASSGAQRPTQVPGVTGASSVTAGTTHACAIVTGGAMRCWGLDTSGELGNNKTTGTSGPVQPVGLSSGVTAISAGGHATCAVQNGSVYCWGVNTSGQLGVGDTNNRAVPTRLPGISGAVGVTLGLTNGYAWDGSGRVWSWGDNSYGQLGTGDTVASTSPVAVSIH